MWIVLALFNFLIMPQKTPIYLHYIICIISFCGYFTSLQAETTSDTLSLYLNDFQYQRAIEYIDSRDRSKEFEIQKALCYKALKNYNKAIEIFSALCLEYPDEISIKAQLADCYQAVGQNDKSLELYTKLTLLDSTNLYFKIQEADILFRKNEYPLSLTAYQNANRQSLLSETTKQIARCFEKTNVLDSALIYYEKALKLDSTDRFSMASIVNIFLKEKDYASALNYSSVFLEQDSTDTQMLLLNGLSYYNLELYKSAIEKLSKLQESGDTSLVVNRTLGTSYYFLNNHNKALPLLDKAYQQDTTNNSVLYCLAVINNNSYDSIAISQYQKLLDRTIAKDLTLHLYYKGLSKAFQNNKEFQKAADNIELSLKYATLDQSLDLLFTISNIYNYDIQNSKKALEYYELYKIKLTEYLDVIKQDESKQKEVESVEQKLKHLEKYIENMQTYIRNKKE